MCQCSNYYYRGRYTLGLAFSQTVIDTIRLMSDSKETFIKGVSLTRSHLDSPIKRRILIYDMIKRNESDVGDVVLRY